MVMAHKVAHNMAHKVAHLVAHKMTHKVPNKVAHKLAHWVGGRHAYNQEGDCVDSTLPPPTRAIYVGHEFRRLCDLVPALVSHQIISSFFNSKTIDSHCIACKRVERIH